jgi:hypothetical protein
LLSDEINPERSRRLVSRLRRRFISPDPTCPRGRRLGKTLAAQQEFYAIQ